MYALCFVASPIGANGYQICQHRVILRTDSDFRFLGAGCLCFVSRPSS